MARVVHQQRHATDGEALLVLKRIFFIAPFACVALLPATSYFSTLGSLSVLPFADAVVMVVLGILALAFVRMGKSAA